MFPVPAAAPMTIVPVVCGVRVIAPAPLPPLRVVVLAVLALLPMVTTLVPAGVPSAMWTTFDPVPAVLPVAIFTVSVTPVAVAAPAMETVTPTMLVLPTLTVTIPAPSPILTDCVPEDEPRTMSAVPVDKPRVRTPEAPLGATVSPTCVSVPLGVSVTGLVVPLPVAALVTPIPFTALPVAAIAMLILPPESKMLVVILGLVQLSAPVTASVEASATAPETASVPVTFTPPVSWMSSAPATVATIASLPTAGELMYCAAARNSSLLAAVNSSAAAMVPELMSDPVVELPVTTMLPVTLRSPGISIASLALSLMMSVITPATVSDCNGSLLMRSGPFSKLVTSGCFCQYCNRPLWAAASKFLTWFDMSAFSLRSYLRHSPARYMRGITGDCCWTRNRLFTRTSRNPPRLASGLGLLGP